MKRQIEEVMENETTNTGQRIKLDPKAQKLESFKNWLNENNVIWENIEIRKSSVEDGLGLYIRSSRTAVKIEIPQRLFISDQAARSSDTFTYPTEELLSKAEDHIDREGLIICLFLLHEKHKAEKSFWFPYLEILPKHISTPLCHTDSYLEYTVAYYLTETMRHSMSELYSLIKSDEFSLEDFFWAYSILTSRTFKVKEVGTVMIPFADVANHVSLDNEVNLRTSGINSETDRFIIVQSNKEINDGDELFIKYNEFANGELLVNYGFSVENNPLDSIMISLKFDLDESYETEMKKVLFFNLDEGLSFDHELKLHDEPIISDTLMASMRLIVMSDNELQKYNVTNIDEIFSSMVSVDNERRALNKLFKIVEDIKESSFTTDLVENRARLKSDNLSDDERYSLIYLIGQKEIVEKILESVHKAIESLDLSLRI